MASSRTGCTVVLLFIVVGLFIFGSRPASQRFFARLVTPQKDTPNSEAQQARKTRYQEELKKDAQRTAEKDGRDQTFTQRVKSIGFHPNLNPYEYAVVFFNDSEQSRIFSMKLDSTVVTARLEVPRHQHRYVIYSVKGGLSVEIKEQVTGQEWNESMMNREFVEHRIWGYILK